MISSQKLFPKRGQRIYGKLPGSPHYRPNIPSLDFLDTFGFKTNVKTIREGDWICMFCQNLNFSFRNECNRCQAYAESPPLREGIGGTETIFQPSSRENACFDYRNYYNLHHLQQVNAREALEAKRNELFEKVCGRDEGFSNVVFISFELKDNGEDSFEDVDDSKQYESTPILQLIDE